MIWLMIWLFLTVVVALVYVADYFRMRAAEWQREAGFWRNEATRLARKNGERLEEFDCWRN